MQNPNNTYSHLVSELKKFFTQANYTKAVLGLSGGLDSAVTLKLLADTIGPDNVTALIMPEHGVTKDENTIHAKRLAGYLKVRHHVIPINKYLMDLLQLPWQPSALAQMNTKARARAIILYNFANTENALVIGTSNKSELTLGYGTKHGDLAADIFPIGDIYKTNLYRLAEYLSLPDEIIQKAPTAELYKEQTDEKELGASYEQLDPFLERLEKSEPEDDLVKNATSFGFTETLAEALLDRIKKNKHKLETPYIIKAH